MATFNKQIYFDTMRGVFIVLVLIFVISSCGRKEEFKVTTVKGFPVNTELYGERVNISDMPPCGGEVWIVDTLLLLKNEAGECGGPYFFVYNLKTLDLLVKFGDHGRGPGEFTNVSFLGQHYIDKEGIKILLNRMPPRSIEVVDLTATLELGRLVIDRSVFLPEVLGFAFEYYLLPDSSFIGRAMGIEGRFFHYSDGKLTLSPFYPDLPREIPIQSRHNLYIGSSSVSSDNYLFASALIHFKQIDVYNTYLDHQFSIRFPDSPDDIDFFRDENMHFGKDLDYFYRDIHVSDRYIYALYYGIKYDEVGSSDYGHSEIHLFSLQGEPLAKYTLNHTLFSITTTKDDAVLYGVAGFSDETILYLPITRFNLPKL